MYRLKTEIVRKSIYQSGGIFLFAVLLSLSFNHFRSTGIPLVENWSPEARLKTPGGENLSIPLAQAIALYRSREAVFVDARPSDLYHHGHIAGAINIPWETVDENIGMFFEKVPDSNASVVIYCDGEACSLSKDLALLLMDAGYTNIHVLVNGWSVWLDHGYPITK